MRKSFLLPLAIGIILIIGACTKWGADAPGKQNSENSVHSSAEKADVGLVGVLKKKKLANYQSTTIGNAFDSYQYLTKKQWKTASLKSGQTTIDFIGWFGSDALKDEDIKKGVTGKGLDVMFVIEPNGSFYAFMASMIESKSDGKIDRVQQIDTAGVLAKIYGNQKI
ncbi:MAG: hypothetical protein M0Z71_06395 [Nitrospiraceae bacterium]|nr:hypothetical protein [Nitrospiraceae bacterium]